MNPSVTRPPGRGILVAAGFFTALATPLAPPLASDLAAQAVALEFASQPMDTEAGQTIPSFTVRAINSSGGLAVFVGNITLSVASGPGQLDGTTTLTSFGVGVSFSGLNIDEAGTYTLQATSEPALTPATSEPFQISPGPPSGATSQITASPSSISATGTSTSTITVQLRDEFGNDLEAGGDAVTLAKSGGGTLTATPVDNGDGTYTGTLTSDTSPETVTVTGTVNGGAIADDATVVFTVAPATQLDFDQQPTTEAAGATITPSITVRAEDAAGNLVPNFSGSVTLTIASGPSDGSLSGTTTRPAMGGIATFDNLSIQRVGSYALRAASGTLNQDTSAPFQITPGPPSGATSEITANPTSIDANESSTSTITVLLRDAFGNALTTGGANVAVSTTLGTLGPVTDNGNGTYSATLTSSTAAGTATISGTVNGATISDTASVDFTLVGAPTLVIQVQPSDTRVGQPISPSVVVRVVDGLGNTLTSFPGSVTAGLSTRPAGANLDGDTVEPFQNGVATFDDLRIDLGGTGYRLGFTAPGAVGVVSSSFSVLSGAASPSQSTIVASPTAIAADGTSTSTITVQLRDANSFPLSTGGDDVTLSTTLGTLGAVRDVGNGSYTATLRSATTEGTARITGTVNGAAITDDATVTFAVGSADLEVEVEVSDDSPVLGGEVVYELTVRNQGPDDASGVALTHLLPPRLELVSATATQGTYTPTSGVWSVGSLDEGAEATLTIVVRILGPESAP
jgi:adhesin/invasin